jgi:hypothetical protein
MDRFETEAGNGKKKRVWAFDPFLVSNLRLPDPVYIYIHAYIYPPSSSLQRPFSVQPRTSRKSPRRPLYSLYTLKTTIYIQYFILWQGGGGIPGARPYHFDLAQSARAQQQHGRCFRVGKNFVRRSTKKNRSKSGGTTTTRGGRVEGNRSSRSSTIPSPLTKVYSTWPPVYIYDGEREK